MDASSILAASTNKTRTMPKSLRNFYNDEILSEAENTIEFHVQIPIIKYKQDTEIPNALNFHYASRDVNEAEDIAQELILSRLELPTFPLSINLVAEFLQFVEGASLYKITVSGENTSFLNSLQALNL